MFKLIVSILIVSNFQISFSQVPELLNGFPKLVDHSRQPGQKAGVPICADLYSNGNKEIIAVAIDVMNITNFQSALHVIKNDGSELQGFPKLYVQYVFDIAVGDIDGDGYLDIVVREQDSIDVINRFGNHINGFPIYYPTLFPIGWEPNGSFVSIYDIEGDGNLDIITGQYGQLAVFDKTGVIKNGWPRNIVGRIHDNPAIGDIDNDGKAEIITTEYKELLSPPHFDSSSINIFKSDGNNYSNNWPIYFDSSVYVSLNSSPSLYIGKNNLDTTFITNIQFNSVNPTNSVSRFIKYDVKGNIIQEYYYPRYYAGGTFVLSDMNRDNKIDIIGGYLGPDLTIYDNNFDMLPGWPEIGENRDWVTTTTGKLTFGSYLNVLTPAWYAINGIGYLFAYDYLGNPLVWSGLKTKGIVSGICESNLFNDSTVDIITTNILSENTFYLNAWQIPGIKFSYDNFPWSMYCHDRYKTNQNGFIPPDEPLGIKSISSKPPKQYQLLQNYPNPFNPITKINYSLPKAGIVKLKIHDILGKKIQTLVNEYKQAGNYSILFDGSKYSSGVYYYKIEIDNFSDAKKMILIK